MNFFSLACTTCAQTFKHGDGPNDAAGWAILFMLCVILPMIGGICFLMFRIAKRESQNLDPKYQDA